VPLLLPQCDGCLWIPRKQHERLAWHQHLKCLSQQPTNSTQKEEEMEMIKPRKHFNKSYRVSYVWCAWICIVDVIGLRLRRASEPDTFLRVELSSAVIFFYYAKFHNPTNFAHKRFHDDVKLETITSKMHFNQKKDSREFLQRQKESQTTRTTATIFYEYEFIKLHNKNICAWGHCNCNGLMEKRGKLLMLKGIEIEFSLMQFTDDNYDIIKTSVQQ